MCLIHSPVTSRPEPDLLYITKEKHHLRFPSFLWNLKHMEPTLPSQLSASIKSPLKWRQCQLSNDNNIRTAQSISFSPVSTCRKRCHNVQKPPVNPSRSSGTCNNRHRATRVAVLSQEGTTGDNHCFREITLPINKLNSTFSSWREALKMKGIHATAAQLINSIYFNQDLLGFCWVIRCLDSGQGGNPALGALLVQRDYIFLCSSYDFLLPPHHVIHLITEVAKSTSGVQDPRSRDWSLRVVR